MPDGRTTDAEAISRFSREIAARGRAPDCAERLAEIHAEHEAEGAQPIEGAAGAGRRETAAGRRGFHPT